MRLLGYALALLVYAAALAALGNPWAGVAAAALSLAATIAFECLKASQRATEAEDVEDRAAETTEELINRLNALEEAARMVSADLSLKTAQVDTLVTQVTALKRNAALNQVG